MKRFLIMLLSLCMVFTFMLSGCGSGQEEAEEPAAETETEETAGVDAENWGDVSDYTVDLGTSELYSQEDMNAAINRITDEFTNFRGCKLNSIKYAGDECNSQENIDWMNDLAEGEDYGGPFVECIEFKSDYHSPVDPEEAGAWEPDTDYKDWEWWLARTEGGDWVLMTNGYN